MEREMQPSAAADGTVKAPLSAVEAVAAVLGRGNRNSSFLKNIGVIPSHTNAPMIQLQLLFDAEKKRRLELESLFDERNKAKEHADAEAIMCVQHLKSIIKEQEETRKIQASCNDIIKQMIAELSPK